MQRLILEAVVFVFIIMQVIYPIFSKKKFFYWFRPTLQSRTEEILEEIAKAKAVEENLKLKINNNQNK